MTYQSNKDNVVDFFESYLIRYIVKDLEVLNGIQHNETGEGACSIPQAIATFSALDLMGYLVHPQEIRTVKLSFSDLLKDSNYFPEFNKYSSHFEFFNSFKDDLRSIMTHRFILANYKIGKVEEEELFIESVEHPVFNVSFFTSMTINVITRIFEEIKKDEFLINGLTKEESIRKIKDRIDSLKDYKSTNFSLLTGINPVSTTIQTTSPPE